MVVTTWWACIVTTGLSLVGLCQSGPSSSVTPGNDISDPELLALVARIAVANDLLLLAEVGTDGLVPLWGCVTG